MRNDNGEITETLPNLEIVPNIDRKSVPLDYPAICFPLDRNLRSMTRQGKKNEDHPEVAK